MKARFVRDAHGIVGALFGTKQLSFKNFLFVLAVVFFIAWVPDGVVNLFSADKFWLGLIQVAVSVGVGLWIRKVMREAVLKASLPLGVDVQVSKNAKGMVLFLSHKNLLNDKSSSSNKNKVKESPILTVFDIKDNRKMPLCALWAHKESLKKVLVIASAKSIKEKEDFMIQVREYMSELVEKIEFLDEHGGEFDDAEKIYGLLKKAFEILETKEKIRPSDIVIDITGGSKIVSIAGAIFTLPAGRQMQYVDSNGNAKVYDMCYKEE